MGLTGSAAATIRLEDVRVPADRRIGEEGQELKIAFAGLDCGRLGIAAVATGLAQGALDHALRYSRERETFGRPIIEHQGLAFVLADMAAAVQASRATALAAARLKDQGLPFACEASIAKLIATGQRHEGHHGRRPGPRRRATPRLPVERYMREAKVMQIFEGTNQIQRLIIGRALRESDRGTLRVQN